MYEQQQQQIEFPPASEPVKDSFKDQLLTLLCSTTTTTTTTTTFSNVLSPPRQQPMYSPLQQQQQQQQENNMRLQNFIFIGTYGKIKALEIIEGAVSTVWTEELKEGYNTVHLMLFISRGHLYAAINGHVLCLDALTGKIIWRVKPEVQQGLLFAFELSTLLCSFDGSIVFSVSNGSFIALNAITGQKIWKISIEVSSIHHDAYTLLEHGELIYVGNKGYIYCFDKMNGQQKWMKKLQGFFYCTISLAVFSFASSDILFIGSNGSVIAMDAKTGETRNKTTETGYGLYGRGPVALLLDPRSNTLYVATSGELRCYMADCLKEIWKSNLPGMGYSYGHSLLFIDHQTIVIGMNGKVAALSKSSGTIIWTYRLRYWYDFVSVAPMGNTDTIVCASSGGLCGLDKRGKLLWQDGLKGMGYESITISTNEFNTNFNSSTLTQHLEMYLKGKYLYNKPVV